jgi:glutathione S-transferase
VTVKLYSIAESHPARAAGLMLSYKGIEHERVDLLPGSQRLMLRLHGFPGRTVPALTIDGRKVQGSLEVSRAVLQPLPRNLFRWCVVRHGELRRRLGETRGMPLPALTAALTKPIGWYFARVVSGATDESIRAQLAAMPDVLGHVDELIASGVIGGEQPNAADFQIATSIRVLLNFPQLRPLIESRPAGELAIRIAPDFGDPLPIELPAEWVPQPDG